MTRFRCLAPLSIAALAVCFAGDGRAQVEPRGADEPPPMGRIAVETRADGSRVVVPATLRAYLNAIPSLAPRRIAPGASGELRFVLALQPGCVFLPSDPVALSFEDVPEGLRLGAWQLDPAGIGALDTAFRGQLVYDNTAIIRVPVHVAEGVAHGSISLVGRIECDARSAESGQNLGRRGMEIQASIVVGPALPVPRALLAAESDAAANRAGAAVAAAAEATATDVAAVGLHAESEPVGGSDSAWRSDASSAQPATASAPDVEASLAPAFEDASVPATSPQTGSRTMLWAGVGFLGLLLLVVLFGRGRR